MNEFLALIGGCVALLRVSIRRGSGLGVATAIVIAIAILLVVVIALYFGQQGVAVSRPESPSVNVTVNIHCYDRSCLTTVPG